MAGRFSISDIWTAIKSGVRMGLFPAGGLFANQNPLKYITGAFYQPIGYMNVGAGLTTTATRIYYFPIVIWEQHAFAGASTSNSGAGDNGKKIRLMIFRDDLTTGGPGTLEKDFGEITLTAAAAVRTLTSTWNAQPGKYWGAVWMEQASAMHGMVPFWTATAAGAATGPGTHHFIGELSAPTVNSVQAPSHHQVDTAYGAAPATAVAPTSTGVVGFGATTGVLPTFYLKA